VSKQHLYCFVDESGQDTLGGFFLVVAVLIEQEFYDNSQETLLNLETATKKASLNGQRHPLLSSKNISRNYASHSDPIL